MDLSDFMVIRDVDKRTIKRYLMPHEGTTVMIRRHPAILLRPVAEVIAGLFIAGYLAATTGGTVGAVIWLIWLALLMRLGWKVIAWSMEFFIITEHRAMVITGVISRRVVMVPLAKVTDIAIERPFIGNFIDYGTFVIKSAGNQDEKLREVPYMPNPERLYLEVSSMIFPSQD